MGTPGDPRGVLVRFIQQQLNMVHHIAAAALEVSSLLCGLL